MMMIGQRYFMLVVKVIKNFILYFFTFINYIIYNLHIFYIGNLKIVEWLTGLVEEDRSDFEKGAGSNINYRNKENLTPLWIACNNGRRDVVQFLLSIGADDTIIGI